MIWHGRVRASYPAVTWTIFGVIATGTPNMDASVLLVAG